MTDLTYGQFEMVHNVLNLTIAIFGGSAFLFSMLQNQVAPSYRFAVNLMAVVVAMAAYHYVRIYEAWNAAYVFTDGAYKSTGLPFDYALRYADWLSTVPFIVASLVLVLDLGRAKSTNMTIRMVVSSMLMLLFGYFGEVQRTDMMLRGLWLIFSMIPFAYMIYVLWVEMSNLLEFETARIRQYFSALRVLLVTSWTFYPIVYCLPMLGLKSAELELGIQIGNSVADILAKAMFGLLIYSIAREKTVEDSLSKQVSGATPARVQA
jgi:bacteriorhodopsin